VLTTIAFRYLGTLLQFIVLAVIARSVSQDDYGLYMLCLSFAFSFYYFLGLGASESALARLARGLALGREAQVGLFVGTVLGLTGMCAAALLITAAVIGIFQPWSASTNSAAIFTLVFLSANGLIFNVSQLLLGLRHTELGSFFFYPAINLVLLFSTVPAALILSDPGFSGLSLATAIGATLASASALIVCRVIARDYRFEWSEKLATVLVREGIGLTCLRVLHVSSFWIPTMVSGFLLAPALAGIMGTAGRLAIAVSAVIAATRFFIRPAINQALARNEVERLRKVMGAVACVTTLAGLGALIANELVGAEIIAFFFGAELRYAASLLSILLIGVIAEAIFGPVDELLKASGHQKAVGIIYGAGVPLFLAGSIAVAPLGLEWIAWLQVFYVIGIFLAMNLVVQRHFGFLVLPSRPKIRDLRSLK